MKVIGLLGAFESGKDYCADKLAEVVPNVDKLGMADPMYTICAKIFGTADKSVPGVRRFLQQLGQIGAGRFSENYPCSVEAANLIMSVRANWHELTDGMFPYSSARKFGISEEFWVEVMRRRITVSSRNNIVVIPNIRFEIEEDLVNSFNGEMFVVRSSEKTLAERRAKSQRVHSEAEMADISEQLWAKRLGVYPCIWNDTEPKPDGCLSIEEFINTVKA